MHFLPLREAEMQVAGMLAMHESETVHHVHGVLRGRRGEDCVLSGLLQCTAADMWGQRAVPGWPSQLPLFRQPYAGSSTWDHTRAGVIPGWTCAALTVDKQDSENVRTVMG